MLRKILIPLFAIAGIAFGIFMIYYGSRKPPVARIIFPQPKSPYKDFVAGEGVIESAYKNILIGPTLQEMITDVYVFVGNIVKKGDPIFKVDTRSLESQLNLTLKEVELAKVDYENYTVQFSFYQRLKDKAAVSEQSYQQAFYNKEIAKKKLDVAAAAVETIKIQIERSTTRAPIDGEVLQVNIRPGEFANANPTNQQPLILFGDTNIYHLRVDIDEEDEWRIIKGASATAFVRGNYKISIPLEYVYYEPYIIPKVELSGADTERVDTRVLQVVYKFPKNKYPIYAGQLLDVYIEAKPYESKSFEAMG
jgi:RND family efflux transporter MFP subunit